MAGDITLDYVTHCDTLEENLICVVTNACIIIQTVMHHCFIPKIDGIHTTTFRILKRALLLVIMHIFLTLNSLRDIASST